MTKHWAGCVIVGMTMALTTSCTSPRPAGLQLGTTFDGVYAGDSQSDPNNGPLCKPGAHVILKIAKGYATMADPSDGRTGWVSSDGSLQMSGWVGLQSASVNGSFQNDSFTGVSSYRGPPHCEYSYPLKRQS